MLSLKCLYCGGSLYFEKEHPMTFCPYCGSHLPDMTQYVQKAVNFEFVKQEHAMHMESEDKEIKKTKVKGIFGNLELILSIVICLLIMLPILILILKVF
jgi:uncharacterized Zn finger protein (UPF0148 family)